MVAHTHLGLEEEAGPLTRLALWGPEDQTLNSVILGVVAKAVMIPRGLWGWAGKMGSEKSAAFRRASGARAKRDGRVTAT